MKKYILWDILTKTSNLYNAFYKIICFDLVKETFKYWQFPYTNFVVKCSKQLIQQKRECFCSTTNFM